MRPMHGVRLARWWRWISVRPCLPLAGAPTRVRGLPRQPEHAADRETTQRLPSTTRLRGGAASSWFVLTHLFHLSHSRLQIREHGFRACSSHHRSGPQLARHIVTRGDEQRAQPPRCRVSGLSGLSEGWTGWLGCSLPVAAKRHSMLHPAKRTTQRSLGKEVNSHENARPRYRAPYGCSCG